MLQVQVAMSTGQTSDTIPLYVTAEDGGLPYCGTGVWEYLPCLISMTLPSQPWAIPLALLQPSCCYSRLPHTALP